MNKIGENEKKSVLEWLLQISGVFQWCIICEGYLYDILYKVESCILLKITRDRIQLKRWDDERRVQRMSGINRQW